MKRVLTGTVIFCLFNIAIMLTGCGQLKDYVSKRVIEESEKRIQGTEEYQKYEEYESEGLLTEEGYYPLPETSSVEDTIDHNKSIKISIANNSFLNCSYYVDEKTKTPIIGSEVYLDPGDSLFISGVLVNNDISNLYDFSCFRVWAYDKEGNRGSTPYKEVTSKNGLLLKIPVDFTGDGFSIEPIGGYTRRHISARAYYLKDGTEMALPSGQWKVNNERFSDVIDISPVDSYTIVYDYSAYKDDYYFVDSTPSCWYSKENNNTVIFREVSSNEQETEFAVKMHPFVTMTVTNSCLSWASNLPFIGDHGEGIIQSIMKGEESLEQGHVGDSSFDIQKLKVGDVISVRVGKEFKISGTGVNIGTAVPLSSNAENGYEYTITVPDTNKGISIEITERNSNAEGAFQGYSLENADVSITRQNGALLKIGEELPSDDEKVTLTITPHENYYIEGFTDKNNYSYIKKKIKFAKLEDDIQSIFDDHPAIKFISFNLVFADESGTYTYKLDNDSVTESPLINVRIGQKLKVNFIVNDGYSITHSWLLPNVISDIKTRAGKTDSISSSIEITSEMDGTTVDRETFGIVVEKE